MLVSACDGGPPNLDEAEATSAATASALAAAPERATSALDSLHAEAEELYAAGEIDGARAILEGELALARETSDSVAIARSLTWLAQAAWRLGDYEATRRLGEEGLALKLAGKDDGDLFRSYNVLGLLAWNEGRLTDALALLQEAAEIAVAAGDSLNLARVGNNLGLVATNLGRYQEAEASFVAARDAARALRDRRVEGRVVLNLGMLALEEGDPSSALAQLEGARAPLEEAEDAVGQQVLLGLLGAAYADAGFMGRAVAHLDTALFLSRETGLRQEEVLNLEQLAELYAEAGDHRRALGLLASASQINEELGLEDERGIDLRREAQIHAELGNLGLGLERAQQALIIHRTIGSRLQEMVDLLVLAELASREAREGPGGNSVPDAGDGAGGELDVEDLLAEAEGIARALAVRSARIEVALTRARIADLTSHPRRVLDALQEVDEDVAGTGGTREGEVETLRARALGALGHTEEAVAAGERAIAAVERIRSTSASGYLRRSYLQDREATYFEQVERLIEIGRTEEALVVADAARSRALLEEGVSSGGDDGPSPPAVRAMQASEGLRRRIDDLADRLDEIDQLDEGSGEDAALSAEALRLGSELESARADYESLLLRGSEGDPRGTALLGGAALDLPALQAALDPGEALLEHLVTEAGIHTFVVTRSGLEASFLAIPREVLASRIRIVRGMLGDPAATPQDSRTALERLHGVLVRPSVESGGLTGIRRLIVVPHAELAYVPFAALLDEASGRHLVDDFVVSYAPSAASLPYLRAISGGSVGASAAAGGVALAPFPDVLPASAAEATTFRRLVRRGRSVVGRRATEEQARRALADESIVHLATHGILNARNPAFSRLELASGRPGGSTASQTDPSNDGRLEVHEVLRLRVGSALVFLSGCETGSGSAWATSYRMGADYATLASAFLFAGAGHVVATQWPIRDASAAAFAEGFYTALDGVRHPADALAEAQRRLKREDGMEAPYHWAAYTIAGG